MGIPLQHFEILVAGNAGHFHYPEGAELKKATGCLVAQIVEIEAFNFGSLTDTIKGLGDSIGSP
jgi:hypothetical protein